MTCGICTPLPPLTDGSPPSAAAPFDRAMLRLCSRWPNQKGRREQGESIASNDRPLSPIPDARSPDAHGLRVAALSCGYQVLTGVLEPGLEGRARGDGAKVDS